MSMSIDEYKKAKPSKYRAVRTEVDGLMFDSKREAARYRELLLLVHFGEITNLERQVVYRLVVNGFQIAAYRADFVYLDLRNDKVVIEDAKGYRDKKSPVYRLFKIKANLLKALHGLEVVEV